MLLVLIDIFCCGSKKNLLYCFRLIACNPSVSLEMFLDVKILDKNWNIGASLPSATFVHIGKRIIWKKWDVKFLNTSCNCEDKVHTIKHIKRKMLVRCWQKTFSLKSHATRPLKSTYWHTHAAKEAQEKDKNKKERQSKDKKETNTKNIWDVNLFYFASKEEFVKTKIQKQKEKHKKRICLLQTCFLWCIKQNSPFSFVLLWCHCHSWRSLLSSSQSFLFRPGDEANYQIGGWCIFTWLWWW